jgi:hypothetical protein
VQARVNCTERLKLIDSFRQHTASRRFQEFLFKRMNELEKKVAMSEWEWCHSTTTQIRGCACGEVPQIADVMYRPNWPECTRFLFQYLFLVLCFYLVWETRLYKFTMKHTQIARLSKSFTWLVHPYLYLIYLFIHSPIYYVYEFYYTGVLLRTDPLA